MCRRPAFHGVIDELRATDSKGAPRKTRTKTKKTEDTKPPVPVEEAKLKRTHIRNGQKYIKVEVLKGLDVVTKAMMDKAGAGGTAPLRLLWELGKLHEDASAKPKRREPSLSSLLMTELRNMEAAKKQKQPLK